MDQQIAKPPLSDIYKNAVLKLWIDISSNSIEFRNSFLTNSMDPDQRRDFINNLIEIWIQLYPKVIGWRSSADNRNLKEIAEKMGNYEKYFKNPALLLDPESGMDLLQFQLDIRICLEALGITSFEEVK